MPIIDTLGPVLAQLNADLTREFGATVTVYRMTQTKVSGAHTTKSYAAAPALTDVPVQFLDPVSAAKRHVFGLTSTAEGMLLFPRWDGALPVINQGDGIKFTSGPYVGRTFLADANGAPDADGISVGVAVTNAPATAVMA